jgi:hypothetical protein
MQKYPLRGRVDIIQAIDSNYFAHRTSGYSSSTSFTYSSSGFERYGAFVLNARLYLSRTSGISGPPAIPTFERPPSRIESTIDLLFRLDAIDRPGLSATEFRNLFAKCPCGLIMTRRSYRGHVCADATTVVVQNFPIVIDLTLDEGAVLSY